MINARWHVIMVGMGTGTARHLRESHGLPEDMIDKEDVRGLVADHVHLHGGKVTPSGGVNWRGSEV